MGDQQVLRRYVSEAREQRIHVVCAALIQTGATRESEQLTAERAI
jgi:hypothetical protein